MNHALNTTIFRQEALDHLNAGEEIEKVFTIITPASWLYLLTALLLLIGILVWGIFATVCLHADALGLIVSQSQLVAAEARIQQLIKNKSDNASDLLDLYNKKNKLYNKGYINRIELLSAKQAYIAAQEELLKTEASLKITMNRSELINKPSSTAIIFINQPLGKKIQPGMIVFLHPLLPFYQQAFVTGKIASISNHPVSKEFVFQYLGNEHLVDQYFTQGAPYLAIVHLKTVIQPGTAITTKVQYQADSPLHLLSRQNG